GFKGLDNTCNTAFLGFRLSGLGGLGVATSSGLIVEVIDDCIAVYSQTGVLQPGFPKGLETFFSVPAPAGPPGCADDAHGHPVIFAPRTFWDPNDQRFWVAALQIEGANGTSTTCTKVSKYWIAVTATADPRGAWHVYNVNLLGAPVHADATAIAWYAQFGFSPDGVFWSANMFDDGFRFLEAKTCGTGKAQAEAGAGINIACFEAPN